MHYFVAVWDMHSTKEDRALAYVRSGDFRLLQKTLCQKLIPQNMLDWPLKECGKVKYLHHILLYVTSGNIFYFISCSRYIHTCTKMHI